MSCMTVLLSWFTTEKYSEIFFDNWYKIISLRIPMQRGIPEVLKVSIFLAQHPVNIMPMRLLQTPFLEKLESFLNSAKTPITSF